MQAPTGLVYVGEEEQIRAFLGVSSVSLTAQGNDLGTERGPWMYGSLLDPSFSIYKTRVLVVECRHRLANGFVAEVGNEVKG